MDLSKIKKVHIIGIGGIGISAVAKLLISQGKIVTGSDVQDSAIIEVLKNFGAQVFIGEHKADNVPSGADLIIYSDAVPESNVERQKAKELKKESLSYFQFLGEYSKNKYTIAISSTHGKTTTTALTGLIFDRAAFDPTVIVGTKIENWDGNLRLGSSNYFIVEADEYRGHMLEFSPQIIICNNLEYEHADYYKDLNDVISKFQEFVNKLPEDGYFIYNADDPVLLERIEKPNCNVVSYGLQNESADLLAKNIKIDHGRQIFRLVYKGQELKDFNLQVPGKFNIANALAASLCALELGVSQDIIKDTLAQFKGAWRRFEMVGKLNNFGPEKDGAMIVSDYAHHPTEIAATIKAAKEFYPDKRLIVAFQPHQKKRTKELFSDFVKTFTDCQADVIILSEIYDVAGREDKTNQISSRDLEEKISFNLSKKIAAGQEIKTEYLYAKDLENTKAEILNRIKSEDLVIIMGAGNIDQVARELVANQ
jgi:UDP-N-acetylmuramate--alanine ligase